MQCPCVSLAIHDAYLYIYRPRQWKHFFYLDIIFSSIHSFLLLLVSGHFKQENAHTLKSWVVHRYPQRDPTKFDTQTESLMCDNTIK